VRNPLSRWLGRGALGNRSPSEYWDQIARQMADRHYRYEPLAEHVSSIILGLLARWGDAKNSKRIMKTDLFEEAFRSRQIMFDVARVNSSVVGIDVSREITYRAKARSRQYGPDLGEYVCCDVRQLPFLTDSIDLVISTSTLDHFSEEEDILVALRELSRVLGPGGTLILTMDNKSNLTYPLIRLWMALGLAPFFIGRTYSISELKSRLKSSGFSVEDATAIVHCPHVFALVGGAMRLLNQVGRVKFDDKIRKGLDFLDRLERRGTKYLTGRFIAVKAVKRDTAQTGQ